MCGQVGLNLLKYYQLLIYDWDNFVDLTPESLLYYYLYLAKIIKSPDHPVKIYIELFFPSYPRYCAIPLSFEKQWMNDT